MVVPSENPDQLQLWLVSCSTNAYLLRAIVYSMFVYDMSYSDIYIYIRVYSFFTSRVAKQSWKLYYLLFCTSWDGIASFCSMFVSKKSGEQWSKPWLFIVYIEDCFPTQLDGNSFQPFVRITSLNQSVFPWEDSSCQCLVHVFFRFPLLEVVL